MRAVGRCADAHAPLPDTRAAPSSQAACCLCSVRSPVLLHSWVMLAQSLTRSLRLSSACRAARRVSVRTMVGSC